MGVLLPEVARCGGQRLPSAYFPTAHLPHPRSSHWEPWSVTLTDIPYGHPSVCLSFALMEARMEIKSSLKHCNAFTLPSLPRPLSNHELGAVSEP